MQQAARLQTEIPQHRILPVPGDFATSGIRRSEGRRIGLCPAEGA